MSSSAVSTCANRPYLIRTMCEPEKRDLPFVLCVPSTKKLPKPPTKEEKENRRRRLEEMRKRKIEEIRKRKIEECLAKKKMST
jgi:hypothetical protein